AGTSSETSNRPAHPQRARAPSWSPADEVRASSHLSFCVDPASCAFSSPSVLSIAMTSAVDRVWKNAVTLLAAQAQLRNTTVDLEESINLAAPFGLQPSIEVRPPQLTNVQGPPCVLPLGSHVFGHSWGHPYVGKFNPSTCGKDYSVAYVKWTASAPLGTQFDRIAGLWVNGAELLRTSTQEPSRRSGVSWEVVKDVTNYWDVLSRGGDVVIALDNVLTDKYNSSFTVDVVAEFYKPRDVEKAPKKPDLVLPVSASTTNYGWFRVEPSSAGSNFKMIEVPRNTEELYMELFLSHHQCDEFFYGNAPNDYANATQSCGGGPFREVQVLVDGDVVGVVWPFPLIFTGGLNPYMWRPVVATGAFDAPTYMLNLTPFLDKFVDGQSHNVSFAVDHGIDFWPIDGNLLVFQDHDSDQTDVIVLDSDVPAHTTPEIRQDINGLDAMFEFAAERSLYAKTIVLTSRGPKTYTIDQRFRYNNVLEFRENGTVGTFDAQTRMETVTSIFDGDARVSTVEDFPLRGRTFFQARPDGSFRLDADIDHTFERNVDLDREDGGDFRLTIAPHKTLNWQHGNATMDSLVGGFGKTEVRFRHNTPNACNSREVAASRGDIIKDTTWTIFHPKVPRYPLHPVEHISIGHTPHLKFFQAHVHPSKFQQQVIRWGTMLGVASAVYQFLTNLRSVPITGRTQVVAMSQEEECEMGSKAALEEINDARVISEGPRVRMRLVSVSEHLFPRQYDWRVWLVDAPGTVNACCYPGGKIVVYTGILDMIDLAVEKGICKNKHDALAVVLSHEIGHALARHSAERMSYLPLMYLQNILGMESPLLQYLFEFALNLPFSRKLEVEADHIGIMLMASACYDPTEAPHFWRAFSKIQNLSEESEDSDDDEFDFEFDFYSTHPANKKREKTLESLVEEALGVRERSSWCHSLKETVQQILQAGHQSESLLQRIRVLREKQEQQRHMRRRHTVGTVHEMENQEIYKRIQMERSRQPIASGGEAAH
ncbi:TPA: LOW QUALITY PROTEIN: hypothetical protein N0F65_008709, partial [Lagenidium giganteum]